MRVFEGLREEARYLRKYIRVVQNDGEFAKNKFDKFVPKIEFLIAVKPMVHEEFRPYDK